MVFFSLGLSGGSFDFLLFFFLLVGQLKVKNGWGYLFEVSFVSALCFERPLSQNSHNLLEVDCLFLQEEITQGLNLGSLLLNKFSCLLSALVDDPFDLFVDDLEF